MNHLWELPHPGPPSQVCGEGEALEEFYLAAVAVSLDRLDMALFGGYKGTKRFAFLTRTLASCFAPGGILLRVAK